MIRSQILGGSPLRFKKLFGEEPNKNLLIDFLNELLKQQSDQKVQVKDLTYTIGIMDFSFDDTRSEQFQHTVKLVELGTQEIFYDKLTFIYLEMTKFDKTESELVTHFDKCRRGAGYIY